MTDAELRHLIATALTGEIVRGLLAGNDTCCFTTQQYGEARVKTCLEKYKLNVRDYAPPGWERRHLLLLNWIKEVKPDVWTHK